MKIPRHIGIIPDGNRRWAKGKNMDKKDGYQYGLEPGVSVVRKAREIGVSELTFYGFTVDNCKRQKDQVIEFQKACVEAVRKMETEDVSILVVGNTKSKFFPEELTQYTSREDNTDKMKVNFLINYGWDWDLKNGFSSKVISRIDLIIRWGGMCRLSGFLPVQSVYADIYIVKEYWPDYIDEHFDEAIQWYQKQDVTLGG